MANEVNIYSPRYLAEVVRQTPAVHTYFRDTFFTNVKTFATERVDIDLVKGDRPHGGLCPSPRGRQGVESQRLPDRELQAPSDQPL